MKLTTTQKTIRTITRDKEIREVQARVTHGWAIHKSITHSYSYYVVTHTGTGMFIQGSLNKKQAYALVRELVDLGVAGDQGEFGNQKSLDSHDLYCIRQVVLGREWYPNVK